MQIGGVTIDPNNLEPTIVAGVDALVVSFIKSKIPSSTKLSTLPALEIAAIATANEALEVFALAKLEAVIATKYPTLVIDFAALKAKINAL